MIAGRRAQLPPQMPAPPSYQKVNPGDQPVMFLVLRSATLPLSTVNEYAETIGQRISMVSGVAQVQVFGAAKYAVRVDVDPRKLAAHGIGIDEVATAIPNANVNLPTGTIYGPDRAFVVLANGQLLRAAAYGPVIIAYRNGNPVRLNEVAHVYDGIENDKSAAGTGGAQHQAGDPEAARHQRRRGRRRRQGRCCRRSASSCRRRCRSTSAPIARRRFASRCTTSS